MKLICFTIIFIQWFAAASQTYGLKNVYTSDAGLSSNHIYDIDKDKTGFLWIATDNGVSRFDGKYFQQFYIRDGLPGLDVLQVKTDYDGLVWVNCFRQLPAYFDVRQNRFIKFSGNPLLKEISNSLFYIEPLSSGRIRFYNSIGEVVVNNKKVISAIRFQPELAAYYVTINHKKENKLTFVYKEEKKGRKQKYSIYQNDMLLDEIHFITNKLVKKEAIDIKTNENSIFYKHGAQVFKTTFDTLQNPFKFKRDTIRFNEKISTLIAGPKHIAAISVSGNIYLISKNSFAIENIFHVGALINSVFIDEDKNIWVGTLDRGVFYYNKNGIRSFETKNVDINPNFLTLLPMPDQILYAGNFYGEVLKISNNMSTTFHPKIDNPRAWIKNIIPASNKVFAITDNGCYPLQSSNPANILSASHTIKTAIGFNDSIIILGTLSGLVKFNTTTYRQTPLIESAGRIIGLAKAGFNCIYYLNATGLFKYDMVSNSIKQIQLKATHGFTRLVAASNNLLWVSTVDGNLLLLKNDTLIATIPNNIGLPENISCIALSQSRIAVGGKTGLCIIDYDYAHRQAIHFYKVSKVDGLAADAINDVTIQNDTIYAATENGITAIPQNYSNVFQIDPQIIAVKINQQTVAPSSQYTIKHTDNITLVFSGIELSGHFKNIQYKSDNENTWNTLSGNTLDLQPGAGKHIIYISATDVNNIRSNKILQLTFIAPSPFYNTIWFWALCALVSILSLIWYGYKRKARKQKAAYTQQLALMKERQKITADLHDDIGANLSSIQLNSAIASLLIKTDTTKAEEVLQKIESQSQQMAEKMSDFIWSMKPGSEEFINISGRIKNFLTEILGHGIIQYKVTMDKEIDNMLTDFTLRKNVLFIAKEAINNAAKYSNASHLTVSFKKLNNNQYFLQIADNGTGFILNNSNKGNGLKNMYSRAKEINGFLKIDSATGDGTIVSLLLEEHP